MTPTAPRPPLDMVLTRSVTLTAAPAPILAWAPAPAGLPTAPTGPPADPKGIPAPGVAGVAATTALRPIDLSQVNWPLTYRLRTLVSERLSQRIDETTDDDARRQIGKMLIPDVLREHHDDAVRTGDTANQIPRALYEPHRKAVESAIFGYGRWQPLFEDADVENIEINSWRNTTMVYPDKIVSVPPVADHDGELIEQLVFMATYSPTPRDFSPAHPEMTLNLEDRWRLHAKAFDTSLNGPSIVIRQHKFGATPLSTLADWGMMPANLPPFLTAAVRARRSILVSGVGGVGKTSLVRSLFLALRCLVSLSSSPTRNCSCTRCPAGPGPGASSPAVEAPRGSASTAGLLAPIRSLSTSLERYGRTWPSSSSVRFADPMRPSRCSSRCNKEPGRSPPSTPTMPGPRSNGW